MKRWTSSLAYLVCFLALNCFGCSSSEGEAKDMNVEDDPGGGIAGDTRRTSEVSGPGCKEPLDIVFALDVSTSMSEETRAIERGMVRLWEVASDLAPDPRIRLVVFVDDVEVVNDCAAATSVEDFEENMIRGSWRQVTRSNYQPNDPPFRPEDAENPPKRTVNYDCAENSLDAIYAAVTECEWRENASKVIVHVSDDTFVEAPAVLSRNDAPTIFGPPQEGIAVRQTYRSVSDALVDAKIRLASFVIDGQTDCRVPSGPSADGGIGMFRPSGGQEPLTTASQGKAFDLTQARNGSIDLIDAVSEYIEEVNCVPILE